MSSHTLDRRSATPRRRQWGLLFAGFALLATASAHAQSYAPETRFHDVAQRHFVVEMARVLAWKENLVQPKIAQITYALAGEEDGAAKWGIQWLDAKGQTVRELSISYPASLLIAGPAFYRDVAKQMTAGQAAPAASLTASTFVQDYWKGADQSGFTRLASLRAAFPLIPPKPAAAARLGFAPQLAGLLAHGALSSLSDRVSLDPVLLARSAAWLALGESMIKDRDQNAASLDALWAPLLFLAGRENAAGELWKKAPPGKTSAVAAGWEFLFQQPKIKDAFVFVAQPEHRRFMMPIMNYHCRRAEMSYDFEDLLPKIFTQEQVLGNLYDHLPPAVLRGSVNTGHALSISPAFARQDWVDTLRNFQPSAADYTGYQADLKKVPANLGAQVNDAPDVNEQDFSLAGFPIVAPLLALAEREGAGPLAPVAIVTARDLLNYGWETTGLQMGARYHFVDDRWGVDELAKSIFDAVHAKLPGLDLFFLPDGKKATPEIAASFARLQEVAYAATALDGYSPMWKETVASFEDYTARHWLDGPYVRASCSSFYHAKKMERILPYIERVRAEGGPLCDGYIRQWFARDLLEDGLRRVPGGAAYKAKLIEESNQREMDQVTFNLLWPSYSKLPAFQRAMEIEKAYWQGATSNVFSTIFDCYVEAHAYEAAKRFYEQVEPRVDSVTFSNVLGPRRFNLAWLENDRGAMEEARQASATGSYSDMMLNISAAAAEDNFKAMEGIIDECVERYGVKAALTSLKSAVPLLPALKDKADPNHEKALDSFAKNSDFLMLQWILATRAKLTVADSVRFFGGEQTDWERQFVVLRLQKNKAAFQAKYDDHEKNWRKTKQPWNATTLIRYFRNELLEIPVPEEQPDLKPADAMTLSERVLGSLKKASK